MVARLRSTRKPKLSDLGLNLIMKLSGLDDLHFGYWDGIEVSIDNVPQAQTQYSEKLASHIPEGVESILDVGCGAGKLAQFLIERGYSVECLAPDPEMVEQARERLGDSAVVHASGFEDFTTERKFDLVLMSESCQYIYVHEGLTRAAQALKPNGFLLIADVFRHRPSPRDRPYISKSGHNLGRFLDAAKDKGFALEKQIDITDNVGPTLDLYDELLTTKALPCAEAGIEMLRTTHPWVFRTLKLFLGRKTRLLGQKYRHQGLDVFRQYRSYLTLLFQKSPTGVESDNGTSRRAAADSTSRS